MERVDIGTREMHMNGQRRIAVDYDNDNVFITVTYPLL
jgi:hypothetical protein